MDSIIYKKVEDEIIKYDKNAKDIAKDVFANINHTFSNYNQYFNFFKESNYMYSFSLKPIKSSNFFRKKVIHIDTIKSPMKDIDESFYEGFNN